jgi:lipopolysaccharide transport system ATP-binding protein
VVDEVLAVGDAEFQKKAIGKMKDISGKDGRTVLFVSHNMASVQKLCTNVLILENGTTAFRGDTLDGIKKYLSFNREALQADVKNRIDRKGGEILRFTNFKITDLNDNMLYSVTSGMSIKLIFEYEAIKDLNNVVIRIQILTDKGELLPFSIITIVINLLKKSRKPVL